MAQRRKKNKQGNLTMITGVIAVLLLIGIGLYSAFSSIGGGSSNNETKAAYSEISLEGQPVYGQEDAPVTIVEFVDFKCPSCKEFHEGIFPQLKKDFIDKGKAKMVLVNFPVLAEDSTTAAMAGEAVFNQDKEAVWKYYEALFDSQPREFTSEFLVELAEKELPEIDAKKLEQELKENTYASAVSDDQIIGRKLEIHSTPTILVNGKEVEAFNYPAIKAAIEEELK